MIFVAKTVEQLWQEHMSAVTSVCWKAISVNENATAVEFFAYPGWEIKCIIDQYSLPGKDIIFG